MPRTPKAPPINLTCSAEECGKSFTKDYADWKRESSYGRRNFYCSSSCAQSASSSRNRITVRTRGWVNQRAVAAEASVDHR